jgi:hypothetical protein
MKSGVVGVLVAILGVVVGMFGVLVALGAWLFPFQPIRPSPFDKTSYVSPPPPVERNRDQTSNLNSERSRLEAEAPKQSRPEGEIPRQYESQAVINDPDGYTNVRSGPGTRYDVVSRVVEGEIFYVIYQQGNWWRVRTREGISGYMHRSRIKIM